MPIPHRATPASAGHAVMKRTPTSISPEATTGWSQRSERPALKLNAVTYSRIPSTTMQKAASPMPD